MECHDAPTAFIPKRSNLETGQVTSRSRTTIALQTEDSHLRCQIEAALAHRDITVQRLGTADEALHRANAAKADVLMIHFQRSDIGPNIACRLHDAAMNGLPTIVFCNSPDEARACMMWSTRIIDILPVQAIRDHRFPAVIDAALLRCACLAGYHGVNKQLSVA